VIHRFTFVVALGLAASPLASANGVLRWGFGARDTGSAGAFSGTNGAIGSSPTDRIPLNWKDRFVFSLGSSYQLNEEWTLRGGYRYGKSPIPDELVTPLNGATLEHTLSVGASWQRSDWTVDFAYAHEFAETSNVGESGYNAGEYSNSSVDTSIDHFSVSLGRRF
jgi:long-subunit fatty acid transport protein